MDLDHLPKKSIVINANSGIEMRSLDERFAAPNSEEVVGLIVVVGLSVVVVALATVKPVTLRELTSATPAFVSSAASAKFEGVALRAAAEDSIAAALEAGAVMVNCTAQEPANILATASPNRRDSVAVTVTMLAETLNCFAKAPLQAASICVVVTLVAVMLIDPLNLTVAGLSVPPPAATFFKVVVVRAKVVVGKIVVVIVVILIVVMTSPILPLPNKLLAFVNVTVVVGAFVTVVVVKVGASVAAETKVFTSSTFPVAPNTPPDVSTGSVDGGGVVSPTFTREPLPVKPAAFNTVACLVMIAVCASSVPQESSAPLKPLGNAPPMVQFERYLMGQYVAAVLKPPQSFVPVLSIFTPVRVVAVNALLALIAKPVFVKMELTVIAALIVKQTSAAPEREPEGAN